MGYYIYSDIVPYVKRYVLHLSSLDYSDELYCKLLEPDCVMMLECDYQKDNDIPDLNVRNWVGNEKTEIKYARDKNVVGSLWKQKDSIKEVYLINESQASNGGEYSMSIVGQSKKEIQAFYKSFSDIFDTGLKIEGPNAIVQWGS